MLVGTVGKKSVENVNWYRGFHIGSTSRRSGCSCGFMDEPTATQEVERLMGLEVEKVTIVGAV